MLNIGIQAVPKVLNMVAKLSKLVQRYSYCGYLSRVNDKYHRVVSGAASNKLNIAGVRGRFVFFQIPLHLCKGLLDLLLWIIQRPPRSEQVITKFNLHLI